MNKWFSKAILFRETSKKMVEAEEGREESQAKSVISVKTCTVAWAWACRGTEETYSLQLPTSRKLSCHTPAYVSYWLSKGCTKRDYCKLSVTSMFLCMWTKDLKGKQCTSHSRSRGIVQICQVLVKIAFVLAFFLLVLLSLQFGLVLSILL